MIHSSAPDEPGYMLAVSLPGSGIDGMDDGTWHVVADIGSGGRNAANAMAAAMIPYVQEADGDLVMFRMDGEPKVVLRRGGKAEAAPDFEELVPYDRALAGRFEERMAAFDRARLVVRMPPAKRGHGGLGWYAGAAALAVAMVAGLAVRERSGPASEPQVATMTEGEAKTEAMRKGAYQVTLEDPRDPAYMITVRYYPKDGKDLKFVVGRFSTERYRRGGGWVPEPSTRWLRDW